MAGVAQKAREVLDADPAAPVTIAAVADSLGVSPAHLVRSFTRTYGIAPHRYLISRRLDLARRRLLDGDDAAHVATATGFYDQAHLTRHFQRLLATTPGRYRSTTYKTRVDGPQRPIEPMDRSVDPAVRDQGGCARP